METTSKKTAMPVIAGTLAIASGGLKLLVFLGLIIASFFVIASPVPQFGIHPSAVLPLFNIPLVLGIVAIIGGIFAIQRKKFGLALIGSIAAFLPFSFLGLASIILIALSKDEF
jgi:hypothetical protein